MGFCICSSTKAHPQGHSDDACKGFHLFESGKHAAQRQASLPPPPTLIAGALLSLHRAPILASRGLSTGDSARVQPASRARCHSGIYRESDMILPVSSAWRYTSPNSVQSRPALCLRSAPRTVQYDGGDRRILQCHHQCLAGIHLHRHHRGGRCTGQY